MKYLIGVLVIININLLQAQTRFLDNSFKVKEPITRTYAIKNGEELKLDIYQPEKDSLQKRPLIVFMHGGGFAVGSRKNENEVKFSQMAAQKGYVAVSISYRLTRKNQSFGCDFEATGKLNTFKNAAEDFLDANLYLVNHQKEFKIDTTKIIAGGSSAGAEAILSAVYNRELLLPNKKKYDIVHFAGAFSLAGAITDARYISKKNAVPAVFFHGTKDNLVPYATAAHHFCEPTQPGYLILDGSRTISKKLKKLGVAYMLYSFKDAQHEISGMPFQDLPEVFTFFNDVFLKGHKEQIEVFK